MPHALSEAVLPVPAYAHPPLSSYPPTHTLRYPPMHTLHYPPTHTLSTTLLCTPSLTHRAALRGHGAGMQRAHARSSCAAVRLLTPRCSPRSTRCALTGLPAPCSLLSNTLLSQSSSLSPFAPRSSLTTRCPQGIDRIMEACIRAVLPSLAPKRGCFQLLGFDILLDQVRAPPLAFQPWKRFP